MLNWKMSGRNGNVLNGYDIEIIADTNKETKTKKVGLWIKLITGAIIGFVNGFWGGGGGMICVPLLQNVIKLPEKKAHATTLLIMLPLSIASLVVYLFSGNLPIVDALKIGVGFVVGGVGGANILKKISNKWLGYLFSIIIIIGGVKMLV